MQGKHFMATRRGRTGTVLAATLVLALSGCQQGGELPLFKSSQAEPQTGGAGQTRSTKLIERDIEAPEVFQVTESGLWDGRPSLGGVWVAHPDVTEPERVLIRNTANDNFVIGALFRRETMGSGPRLQVSSDAAAALGMLAGSPQQLNVTALRRETVDPEPAPAAAPPSAAAVPPAAAVATDTLDPIGSDTTEVLAATAAPEAVPAPEAPVESTGKKGLFGWLKKGGSDSTATAETPASATGAEVAVTPLDSPAATAPAPAAQRPSPLDKPYIQLGIFSVKQNAENTATAMRQRNLPVEVLTHESQGKTFYRVIAGPAMSAQERDTMIKVIKGAGFTDAYPVTN